VKKNSFGLLELEMADLEHFLRKTPLGLLGIKTFISCTQGRDALYNQQHSVLLKPE
jgi:hypothetical protein